MSTCAATRKDGSPCAGIAQEDKTWCRFHDPEAQAEQLEAKRKGGAASAEKSAGKAAIGKVLAEYPDINLEQPRDVLKLLSATLTWVMRGGMDPRVGRTIAALCNVAMAVFKQEVDADTDGRLKELEERTRPFKGLPVEKLLEIVRASRAGADAAEH